MRNMKKLSFLWILALTSIVSAQELKQPTYIVVGSYKASVGDVDSLKVKIEEQKKNIVLVEYNGLAKIVNTTYATNNLICIKKNKLSDFIEALVYIRDKAIEWNGVLEKRGIEQYEKEFRERLQSLLEEIFNPEVPFMQTEIEDHCKYCDFRQLCRR